MDIAEWIDRRADLSPDDLALHFEGADISYGTLAGRVARLAVMLRRNLGIEPGDRIAFLGYNSPEFIDLLFACARVGAIVVPLNWRLTAAEHLYILGDCAPSAILVEPEFVEHVDRMRGDLGEMRPIAYGPEPTGWSGYDALLADSGAGEDGGERSGHRERAILIVYTSGTTGRPKGAVLTQDALYWNAMNSTAEHDLTSRDHVLTTLPLFHVGGLNIQTVPALHAGARVTIHRRFEPGPVLRAIAKQRPTLFVAVPATMKAMIDHPDWEDTDLSSLRMVTAGSSVVPEALIRAFHARGVPVTQVYGATETAPIAIHLPLADAERKIGSTGKPALHCEARIVDADGKDVAPGETGEILVRGPNLMREYWNNPEATKAALAGGWYHSGDVGHQDDEGYFYIDERKNDVIISGSENIYPAEIENVLADCADIAEAAAVGRRDERWGQVPVAVIVPKAGSDLDADRVLAMFENRLARYKHPREVVFVERLPRNAMGKVLRYELREMLDARAAAGRRDRTG